MEVKTTICIQRDDEDLELYIFGDAEGFTPGNRRGHPDNWTPDEGGGSCVEGIFLDEDANKPWDGTLTKEETQEAEEALMGQLEEDYRDAEEAAAEAKAEARAEAEMDRYDDDYGDYGPDIYDF